MTASILGRARIECVSCSNVQQLCTELESGASAVMLPEEAIGGEQQAHLTEWLARQPAWSDLPVLVLARPGADSANVAQAMDRLGNVTVLERPTRVSALVSAARTALRARQRQYQIREQLTDLLRNDEALREADIPELAKAACWEADTNYPVPRYMSPETCEEILRKVLPGAARSRRR